MDEKDDVFTTKLGIGPFVVLITLVTELVVLPLFEILKNRLTNAIAIHRVASSALIVLRSDTRLSHMLGVSDSIKNDTWSFRAAYFIKVFFKSLIIGMLVYWEGSLNEVTIFKTSGQQLAQGRDQLSGIRIMSPMPFTGLSENEIIRMVTFSPNGVEQNGTYAVLNGDDYTFSGEQGCTTLTKGKLTIFLSRIEITGRQINKICLDGMEGKPAFVAAELNIRPADQTRYDLTALTLDSDVATDGTTTIYRVSASHNEKDKVGYAALTAYSHQNGNTKWSLYGLLHGEEGSPLEYLNIPISGSAKPCEDDPIGIWKFSEQSVTCPSGTSVKLPTGNKGNHIVDANWFLLPKSDFLPRPVDSTKLALQWVAEAPFSEYVAKTKLSEEIWSRMNREVYFVSDYREIIELPEEETVKYTQTSRKRAIVTTATLSAVLCALVSFLIAEQIQKRRHNIKMDFCDVGTVLGMWNSEVFGEATCALSRTSITVGLIQSGAVGPQHIGTSNKFGEPIRSGDSVKQHANMLDHFQRAKRDPERLLE